jgi:hypothetical protein
MAVHVPPDWVLWSPCVKWRILHIRKEGSSGTSEFDMQYAYLNAIFDTKASFPVLLVQLQTFSRTYGSSRDISSISANAKPRRALRPPSHDFYYTKRLARRRLDSQAVLRNLCLFPSCRSLVNVVDLLRICSHLLSGSYHESDLGNKLMKSTIWDTSAAGQKALRCQLQQCGIPLRMPNR